MMNLRQYIILLCILCTVPCIAQKADSQLERMPENLETEYALSSLPAHLREKATVYLLNPRQGYYVARQGSNGFICFVVRTEWNHPQFRNDLATPISFDAEGSKVLFPVYADVASMRASGKFSLQQINDSVSHRVKSGRYKIPKPGVSYMLAPVMRTYEGDSDAVATISAPHYMFYAPYLSPIDFGCMPDSFDGSRGPIVFGDGTDPHGFAIISISEKEKTKIMEEQKMLLKRLAEYKPYFQFATKNK